MATPEQIAALEHIILSSPYNGFSLTRYFQASALTCTLYDHLLTLNDEIAFLWSGGPLTDVKALYILIRFGIEAGLLYLAFMFSGFRPHLSDELQIIRARGVDVYDGLLDLHELIRRVPPLHGMGPQQDNLLHPSWLFCRDLHTCHLLRRQVCVRLPRRYRLPPDGRLLRSRDPANQHQGLLGLPGRVRRPRARRDHHELVPPALHAPSRRRVLAAARRRRLVRDHRVPELHELPRQHRREARVHCADCLQHLVAHDEHALPRDPAHGGSQEEQARLRPSVEHRCRGLRAYALHERGILIILGIVCTFARLTDVCNLMIQRNLYSINGTLTSDSGTLRERLSTC
ncbi:hypothetical protein PsYK624_098130 [Phanerochaete sordida]|uniref:DUF6533 domain-containing protein n=1 Tax=Phanerochaete sordida TaxID=48140 RepID=A0A9P3GEY6_9APHY|nr:hypothetical protein PsYK624_098130 [Phanerochaete sordida]